MDMYMSEAANCMPPMQAWQVEENGGALHLKLIYNIYSICMYVCIDRGR